MGTLIGILAAIGLLLIIFSVILMAVDAISDQDISIRLVIWSSVLGFVVVIIGLVLSTFQGNPPCTTTATRTYICGKGGTCTETICLDNYKLQRQPSGNPVQVDPNYSVESKWSIDS